MLRLLFHIIKEHLPQLIYSSHEAISLFCLKRSDKEKFSSLEQSSSKLTGCLTGECVHDQEEQRRALAAEREKRAAAAERRIAALNARLTSTTVAPPSSSAPKSGAGDAICSCCSASLEGKVPFHRYDYKYCSTSCMHVHREMLEDG